MPTKKNAPKASKAMSLDQIKAAIAALQAEQEKLEPQPKTKGLTGNDLLRYVELGRKIADAPDTQAEAIAEAYYRSDEYTRILERAVHRAAKKDKWHVTREARKGLRNAKYNVEWNGLSKAEQTEYEWLVAKRG